MSGVFNRFLDEELRKVAGDVFAQGTVEDRPLDPSVGLGGTIPAEAQTFMDQGGRVRELGEATRDPFTAILDPSPLDAALGEVLPGARTPPLRGGPPNIQFLNERGELRSVGPDAPGGGFSRENIRRAAGLAAPLEDRSSPFDPEPGPFGSRPREIDKAIARFRRGAHLPTEGETPVEFEARQTKTRFDRLNAMFVREGLATVGNPTREADLAIALEDADQFDMGELLTQKNDLGRQLLNATEAEGEGASPESRLAAAREVGDLRAEIGVVDERIRGVHDSLKRALGIVEEMSRAQARGFEPEPEKVARLGEGGMVSSSLTGGQLVPAEFHTVLAKQAFQDKKRAKQARQEAKTAVRKATEKAAAVRASDSGREVRSRSIGKLVRTTSEDLFGKPVEFIRSQIGVFTSSSNPTEQKAGRILANIPEEAWAKKEGFKEKLADALAAGTFDDHRINNRTRATQGLPPLSIKQYVKESGARSVKLTLNQTLQRAESMIKTHQDWVEFNETAARKAAAAEEGAPALTPHPLQDLFPGRGNMLNLTQGQITQALERKYGGDDKAMDERTKLIEAIIPELEGGGRTLGTRKLDDLAKRLVGISDVIVLARELAGLKQKDFTKEELQALQTVLIPNLNDSFPQDDLIDLIKQADRQNQGAE